MDDDSNMIFYSLLGKIGPGAKCYSFTVFFVVLFGLHYGGPLILSEARIKLKALFAPNLSWGEPIPHSNFVHIKNLLQEKLSIHAIHLFL